jgi:small-conductance mechanosensitive channel
VDTAALLRDALSEADVKEEIDAIQEVFTSTQERMDELEKETQRRLKMKESVSIIEEMTNEWIRIEEELDAWLQTLSSKADSLGSVLENLQREKEIWVLTNESAATGEFPPALKGQIQDTLTSIDSARQEVQAARDRVLNLQVEIGDAKARADELVADQREEVEEHRLGLLRIDSPPLWEIFRQPDSETDFSSQIKEAWQVNYRWFKTYVSEQKNELVAYGLLLVVLIVFLVYLRSKVRVWVEQDKELQSTLDLIERPIAAAVVITVLLYRFMNPTAPRVWSALLGFLVLLAVLRILPQLSLKTHGSWPYFLALLFFLAQAVKLTPEGYTINRLALLLLSLAGVGISLWLTRPWIGLPKPWERVIKLSARTSAVLFGVGVIANVVGSVGLVLVVVSGTLYAVFAAIVFLLVSILLRALLRVCMHLRTFRRFGIFSRRGEVTRRTLFRIITILAVLGWVIVVLREFLLFEPVVEMVNRILDAKASIGSFSLTFGSVLTFAIVIWASFKFSQFLRFLLDTDVFPSMKLARGIPETVTRLTHYAVIVVGVLIGISAAGVPLDKATIVFGAFGVGIGFGLQNIVNNFVSGLVLMFERPIQIGDTIQVGTLEGIVREMGIRASIVRTYRGASVIVPNADLISAQVVNWTHRDEQRRVDIPVGVAYGTDPQKVIDLLVEVAKAHPEVFEDPEPTALFSQFGASSLDFQLRAWTVRARFLSVDSELRVAVNRALSEAGIEIPFPQRDLHLRSVDGGVSLPVAKTPEEDS